MKAYSKKFQDHLRTVEAEAEELLYHGGRSKTETSQKLN